MHNRALLSAVALCFLVAGCESKKDEPAKMTTYKVEKGPFAVVVALKGILEAREMTPVALGVEALELGEVGRRPEADDRQRVAEVDEQG